MGVKMVTFLSLVFNLIVIQDSLIQLCGCWSHLFLASSRSRRRDEAFS